MTFRNQSRNPRTLIRVGMACLAIALIWPRFLHLTFNFGPDLIDGVRGLLLGLSIGLNLWAVWLMGHQRRSDESRSNSHCG